MIRQTEISFSVSDSMEMNSEYGALLHGVLMEYAGREYGETLHGQGYSPFSQGLYKIRGKQNAVWRINSLNDEFYDRVVVGLIAALSERGNLFLNYKKRGYDIKEINETSFLEDELVRHCFCGEDERSASVRFLTPCSFRSFGKNVFFPESRLLIKSLMKKADQIFPQAYYDALVLDELVDNFLLKSYELRSTLFFTSDVKTKAFTGRSSFGIGGALPLRSLCRLLLSFAPYCGIGSKCAQGMGLVDVALK